MQELESHGILYSKIVQKPGDAVISPPKSIHWVLAPVNFEYSFIYRMVVYLLLGTSCYSTIIQ
ncbi:MAG: hypothetical protein ACYCUI_15670 [Vulcanimicrobiaceae bacterium]